MKENPWLDIRLSEELIEKLWSIVDNSTEHIDTPYEKHQMNETLAGNISKSEFIQDTDNRFYKTVLKELTEYSYYKNWNNYYNVRVAKSIPPSEFCLNSLWVNYQKKYEFNPPHMHSALFSFVVFMKIPTHWKEQHALPISVNSNEPSTSDFQFLIGQGQGPVQTINIPLSPEDEGRMLFFPAVLSHQVFPFYGTEEERITISGNIQQVKDSEHDLQNIEKEIENLKTKIRSNEGLKKQLKKKI